MARGILIANTAPSQLPALSGCLAISLVKTLDKPISIKIEKILVKEIAK